MKDLFTSAASRSTWLGLLSGVVLTAVFAFKIVKDKPACAISLDKQNIFYTGLDNPVSIVVRGVPEEKVVATGQGIELKKTAGDDYIVRASTPGEGTILVSGGDLPESTFKYRVKRIPDPVPLLGAKYRSGSMGSGVFKAQSGVFIVMENFDFDVQCQVVGYEMTYQAKRQDPVILMNRGSRFNPETQEFINRAEPGMVYFFDDIKVKCPGDEASRSIGGLVFKIK